MNTSHKLPSMATRKVLGVRWRSEKTAIYKRVSNRVVFARCKFTCTLEQFPCTVTLKILWKAWNSLSRASQSVMPQRKQNNDSARRRVVYINFYSATIANEQIAVMSRFMKKHFINFKLVAPSVNSLYLILKNPTVMLSFSTDSHSHSRYIFKW